MEAISLSMRIANSGAEFEGRGLMQALRTRAGRLKIMAGFALNLRRVAPPRFTARTSSSGTPARRAARRSQRLAHAPPDPERPTPPLDGAERENGSCGF